MKKKPWIAALALLLVLALGGGLWHSWERYWQTHLRIGGETYALDIKELDLSGTAQADVEQICRLKQLEQLDLRDTGLTVEEYETLRQALPRCEIRWQVPFQGQYLETDTRELVIKSLTAEDMALLTYLPELKIIHAEGCAELDRILELTKMYPDCEISWMVPLGSKSYPSDTRSLYAGDADVEILLKNLKYLPRLEQVSLGIPDADNETVERLLNRYPQVDFRWFVAVGSERYINSLRELDLSGTPMESVEDVEHALKYFPNLERVVMCGCGIPSEEMDALWKRNPEIRFVWSVPIRNFTVRTDVTYFMPYQYGCERLYNSDAKELKYLVDVTCMDLGHMMITDLSFLPYLTKLEYLIVADCGVKDITPVGELKNLKYLELFKNRITDLSPLAGCTALRDLNICYNKIWDFTPLFELEHMEHLWVSGNMITMDMKKKMDEAFPEATIMYRTYSSTGNGWRKIPGYYEQRDILGMWYMNED